MLCRVLNLRTTVAVVGSGCSRPLGYPGWHEMAEELLTRTVDALSSRPHQGTTGDGIDRLTGYRDQLRARQRTNAPELMFYVGVCKRILGEYCWTDDPYQRFFRDRFERAPEGYETGCNPHEVLVHLPVRRFVTTNYDVEIERALSKQKSLSFDRFGIDKEGRPPSNRLSFTQEVDESEQLVRFAMARPRGAPMVFHCHGRFDRPASVIATERDYQRWYLGGHRGFGTHFSHVVELLFGSNPLLFVGYGLGDEDLLRPLRILGAADPQRKQERPIFAILPEAEEGGDWHRHENLFERYGLHVIPYLDSSSDPEQRGRALGGELERLTELHRSWYESWLRKPKLRRVVVESHPPRSYRHSCLYLKDHEVLGRVRVETKLQELAELAHGNKRVICLVGPGGTGKSWHAIKLLEKMEQESSRFKGFFFWSSYYSDDYLTGLDRALAYLDPDSQIEGSRHERFRRSLKSGRFLLVFDGFERLLRQRGGVDVGEPYGKGCERLIETFLSTEGESTVILTTRLRPASVVESDHVHIERLGRLQAEDLYGVRMFRHLRDQVPALCSLLDGHTYGLLLAGEYLRRSDSVIEGEDRFRRLKRDLAASPPDRRVSRLISVVIHWLDSEWRGLATGFLEKLAYFMSPLTQETVRVCYELAAEENNKALESASTLGDLDELIRDLLECRILFRVVGHPTANAPKIYTVHPTVRSYLFYRSRRARMAVLPNFTLPGFTSGTAVAYPGSRESARTVKTLFSRLLKEAELRGGTDDWKSHRDASGFCRSAFSLLRSRMEAITTPRWSNYGEYVRLGIRLADLARTLSPELWDYQERHLLHQIEDPRAPLYADELAWLYNDLGLTFCSEGSMRDAYALWEQGYEINRIIEGDVGAGQYVVQSQLHLGHTFIELGALPVAEQYLRLTEQSNLQLEDQDYAGRIIGYFGLLAHLRGDLDKADNLYGDAIGTLQDAGGNPRAESIFRRYWADLKMTRNEMDRADDLIHESRAIAQVDHHPDIVAFVTKSLGHWYRDQREFGKARLQYDSALARARKFGIRRLEADVLSELSKLAFDLGDYEMARIRAMEAMAIANELGLGLRRSHGLVVLGRATLKSGPRMLGLAYLRYARELADQQEYWLRAREAEKHLQHEGEPLDLES